MARLFHHRHHLSPPLLGLNNASTAGLVGLHHRLFPHHPLGIPPPIVHPNTATWNAPPGRLAWPPPPTVCLTHWGCHWPHHQWPTRPLWGILSTHTNTLLTAHLSPSPLPAWFATTPQCLPPPITWSRYPSLPGPQRWVARLPAHCLGHQRHCHLGSPVQGHRHSPSTPAISVCGCRLACHGTPPPATPTTPAATAHRHHTNAPRMCVIVHYNTFSPQVKVHNGHWGGGGGARGGGPPPPHHPSPKGRNVWCV